MRGNFVSTNQKHYLDLGSGLWFVMQNKLVQQIKYLSVTVQMKAVFSCGTVSYAVKMFLRSLESVGEILKCQFPKQSSQAVLSPGSVCFLISTAINLDSFKSKWMLP